MKELLTSVTIWLALGCYAVAQLQRRQQTVLTGGVGLCLSAIGWVLYVGHVLLALEAHYDWSHVTAYTETAVQTERLTGWRWGGGLYVNYLFSIVWGIEVSWWWLTPSRYHNRANWLELWMRAFFLLMIVTGAVAFVSGHRRWLGLLIVSILLVAWRPSERKYTK